MKRTDHVKTRDQKIYVKGKEGVKIIMQESGRNFIDSAQKWWG